ncbi:MAG: UDP-N-acetylmuramate--L-alanine ligase [Clostridia bacterium]|nr:UDP-N-acetylmuramate--L-alanine ligase [Clostridia bacterium]
MEINEICEILKNARRLHFVGIGGISMSSLAMIAVDLGFHVTGSDRNQSELCMKLESAGAEITYGHKPENVVGADAVIYTAAVKSDNPEMKNAGALGIPCLKRAEFLGYIMKDYRNRIGVAGMHGKSTTTSMLSQIFIESAVNPTIVSGAELGILDGAYRVGSREHFIFEACEYTDSFLSFLPTVAIVLNIDRDHVDYFLSMEQTIESFRRYISLADTAVVNWDDARVRLACEGYRGNLVKCGFKSEGLDYKADNITYDNGFGEFDILCHGALLGHIKLSVPGEHSIIDALCASASSHISGIDFEAIRSGLLHFTGAHRRFEKTGEFNGVDVYDDYAHHPSEISTTLHGVSKRGYKKIFCVFQPHTYSRTAGLFNEFANAFSDVDTVIFADIYAARETNTFGVSSKMLASAVGSKAIYLGSFENIVNYIKENAAAGDLVITMGAGDVWKVGEMLCEK